MAAAIYHYGLGNETPGAAPIHGQVLHEEETYFEPGFGDGSGLERIVTVFYGRVEIMAGRVALTDLDGGRQAVSMSDMKWHSSLDPGEEHIEELTGPAGTSRLLHIRNINETLPYVHGSYFFHHPSHPDGVSLAFN